VKTEALSAKTVEAAAIENLSFIGFSVSPACLRPIGLEPMAKKKGSLWIDARIFSRFASNNPQAKDELNVQL
jgi:hypothetical protein